MKYDVQEFAKKLKEAYDELDEAEKRKIRGEEE